MRRLAPAVLAAMSLAGCAAGFRCERSGGPPWRVLETDHFELVTDVPGRHARNLLRDLEVLRATLVTAVLDTAQEVPGRVRVVALRSAEELWELQPPPAAGFYAELRGTPTIVLQTALFNEQNAILAHELAHMITARVLLRQPRWLSEGLAEYLSSARESRGRGLVGDPPGWYRRRPVPTGASAALLAWDGTVRPDSPDPTRLYRAAWATVHYLVAEESARFNELQRKLARADDPALAWAAVFPEYDPSRPGGAARLDAAVENHLARGRIVTRAYPVTVNPKPTERFLPPAEVHALRLLLLPLAVDGRSSAADVAGVEAKMKAEVAEALREDPDQPDALRLLALLERRELEPLARRAVAAHPSDATAWEFLAVALPGEERRGERIAALEKAAELAPGRADLLDALASALLEDGRSGAALPVARTAAQLAPWDASVLDTYAAVVADLGQCPEALAAQLRAVDLLPERLPAEARREYVQRLATYSERCGAAEASPSASEAR
jgi:Flp pilus assembly protein TadD